MPRSPEHGASPRPPEDQAAPPAKTRNPARSLMALAQRLRPTSSTKALPAPASSRGTPPLPARPTAPPSAVPVPAGRPPSVLARPPRLTVDTSSGSERSTASGRPTSQSSPATTPSSSPSARSSGEHLAPVVALAGHPKQQAFAAYLAKMAQPRTYGTEVELEALAHLLARPLHVFRTERVREALPDGTVVRSLRMAAGADGPWILGSEYAGAAPLALRHVALLDANGRGADSNGNHFDALLGPAEALRGPVTLGQLDAATRKVRGDGACLFRAVAAVLAHEANAGEPAEDAHLTLRRHVVDWERSQARRQVGGGMELVDRVID